MRNSTYLKQLGNKVKALRMSKGLLGREVAEMAKTDYSNYCRFENGQVNIRILTLMNISDALNVDVKDFI